MTLQSFQTKKQYYLTNFYWPHWHSYYTSFNFYPYYNFYWFFYGHYHNHFPHYYSYFFHNHPHIDHFHVSNTVYLTHGHPILINSHSLVKLAVKKYNIVRCQKGPKHLLTIHYKGKHFRIFLGDVNDFTNLGCLYFMDSVVSVGKSNFVSRVSKLYKSKTKVIKVNGKKIRVSPFKKNPYSPSKTKVKALNKNASKLTFNVNKKKSTNNHKKILLFFHLFNKQYKKPKDSIKIFKGLHKNTSKSISNVLYIADHLETNSIFILKHWLSTYKKLSQIAILKITYRRIRLFSGLLVHSHTTHHHHHHIHILRKRNN